MTTETAEFLWSVIAGLTLNVGADDFDATVQKVIAAKAELRELIDQPAR